MIATGSLSVALGVGDKIVATGICTHPDKRCVNEHKLNSHVRMSEQDWPHCIFCKDGEHCYFGGMCEHQQPHDDQKGGIR